MPPKRIDHAVMNMVLEMLLVRRGELLTFAVATERAANIAAAIVGNFKVTAIPEDRPDPNGDDGRIT